MNKNIVIGVVVAVIAVALIWWVGTQKGGMLIQQDANLAPQGEVTGQNVDPVTGGPVVNEVPPANNVSASGTLNTEFQGSQSVDPITGKPLEIKPLADPVTVNKNAPSPNQVDNNGVDLAP